MKVLQATFETALFAMNYELLTANSFVNRRNEEQDFDTRITFDHGEAHIMLESDDREITFVLYQEKPVFGLAAMAINFQTLDQFVDTLHSIDFPL